MNASNGDEKSTVIGVDYEAIEMDGFGLYNIPCDVLRHWHEMANCDDTIPARIEQYRYPGVVSICLAS